MIHQDQLQFERAGSHLKTERRTIAALMVGFWLTFQLIFYFQMAFMDDREALTPGKLVFDLSHSIILAPQLVTTAFGCVICTGIYQLLHRLRRQPRHVQVEPIWNVDFTAAHEINDQVTLYANVLNVFDDDPPFDHAAAYGLFNFNPAWAGPNIMGRYFRVGAKVDF